MEDDITFGYLVACLHRLGQRFLDRELAGHGLGSGTYPFLYMLMLEDGLGQMDMSRRLHTDKANTARAVRKLVDLGYVVRRRGNGDRRVVTVHLTERGRGMFPVMTRVADLWHKTVTEGFDEHETDMVRDLLTLMMKRACERLDERQNGTSR